MTIGLKEVKRKQQEWAELGKKKRQKAMGEALFPAVIGPAKAYYILDHHHTAVALMNENTRGMVQVGVVTDLSALSATEFWVYLDHLSWVHPYDKHGKRRPLKEMPSSFQELRDDPYRSLAGEVRDSGGFAKSDAPFLEFLWTNYFRAHVRSSWVRSHYRKALKRALTLAASDKTCYLPGWVGARSNKK
jgi:hypothetical protein